MSLSRAQFPIKYLNFDSGSLFVNGKDIYQRFFDPLLHIGWHSTQQKKAAEIINDVHEKEVRKKSQKRKTFERDNFKTIK